MKYDYPLHTDRNPKNITFVFYLADDNKNEHLGTMIYDKEKKWDTDVAQAGLCDLVWRDHQDMISLNRNDVGNLIGIELLALNGIVEKFRY